MFLNKIIEIKSKELKNVKRLFKTYGSKSESDLRHRLLENPCVIKASGCRYRDWFGYVTIYYDALTDLFAIVDSKSNKLLDFSIATNLDYADIFRYKCIFQDRTSSELIQCPNEEFNPFEPTCPVEELQENPLPIQRDKSVDLNNFDNVRKKGLSNNYDIVDGWWLDRQKEILRSMDSARFEQLSIEMIPLGPRRTVITEIEVLTILQAEQQNLVGGISRPDMINDQKEKRLNLDFKISSYNEQIFIGWQPTYVDVKSPFDPEVIRACNEPDQTLEDQVDNLLTTISRQRQRALENDESVIHIITLLRIKPSDRAYFMDIFNQKSLRQNLDLNGITFLNTSSDII